MRAHVVKGIPCIISPTSRDIPGIPRMFTADDINKMSAAPSEISNKKRQPNWTKDDCLLLAELVRANKQAVEGRFSAGLSATSRQETWQTITDRINSTSLQHRTKEEVIKKWKNLKSAGKKNFSTFNNASTATGGGPPPTPVSPVTDAVVECIGRDNTVLTGIGPNTMDSTLIQFLELERNYQVACEQERLHIPSSTQSLQLDVPSPPPPPPPPSSSQAVHPIETLMKEKLQLEIECLNLKKRYLKRKLDMEE